MGKSPGKWIKTVLFGKKSSKSNLSKDVTAGKRAAAPTGHFAVNLPLVSDRPYQATDTGAGNPEYDRGTAGSNSSDDAEIRRQEQAATKAQAAFRGYLARRAFLALKGIIRLQALIRGHLVRRQALATFRCMRSIVRLQAWARGQRVRLADPRHKVMDAKKADVFGRNSSLGSEKLVTNAFVCKLLALLPTAMPLSFQYDVAEPNSARNWLERWSSSRFWEPRVRIKKTSDAKSQRKMSGTKPEVETEAGESKRSIRKVGAAANGENRALASLEQVKPKNNPRKVTSHQAELVQEQPQNELERVKRNLRKVSASMAMACEKTEKETEKQNQCPTEVSSSAAPNVFKQKIVNSSPKLVDMDVEVDKPALTEALSKPLTLDESVESTHDDHPAVEPHSSEICGNRETLPAVCEELSSKEENNSKEKLKIGRRKTLPAKQEYPENASQNTLSLPSYMAATESAKAKLRAQGSSKIEDVAENGFVRRHSLPASTNEKLSSLSPRTQRPVQANGRGGSKKNRSLESSRDDKVLQPGWRR
ncbi:Protein IQ-DOMAIN 31 [Abeliophyllum distichum]|uniref:Protein IQ-DOMAIN 31 n=1 Tax=Abeliophyllum distichum TaxID=126358 RepID=A0ABD1SH39_9LAMI